MKSHKPRNPMKTNLLLLFVIYQLSFGGSSASRRSLDIANDNAPNSDTLSIKSDNFDAVQNSDRELSESKNREIPMTISNIIIPTFKEWRKLEMAKHDRIFPKDRIFHQHKKMIRRKLNYASSKCGAKILASNPEARHRMAVLSEKSDEYFLNPCRVQTWFVIELCDSVEATQVELANYELYSSSPKEFSVFSSDVYPSFLWHHLGTFVAEDKRTMQTFDVNKSSMGKFIKVIIHSHHGREHYCPLSVIRVLGFSMVQTLEDIENDEDRTDSDFNIQSEEVATSPSLIKTQHFYETNIMNIFMKNMYITRLCNQVYLHCSKNVNINATPVCLNKPVCQYLEQIMKKIKISCEELYCPRYPVLFLKKFNDTFMSEPRKNSSNIMFVETEESSTDINNYSNEKDIIKDYEHKKSLRIKKESSFLSFFKFKDQSVKLDDKTEHCHRVNVVPDACKSIDCTKSKGACDQIIPKSKNAYTGNKDISGTDILREMMAKENISPEVIRNGDDVDSAGLINKESVLYKLAGKIKSSETDLNLINKYLQQLSQSYRYQIEDMKIKFNKTFETMVEESEKSTEFNMNQEQKISYLKNKIDVLNNKISFLMKGKNELTKRVIELHGFFLIIEIIIIATVFSIFMNIFNKKNIYNNNRNMKYIGNY